jgi:hypothetical protein
MSESLVINLTGLDCVTFVENCLVFARCIKLGRQVLMIIKLSLRRSVTVTVSWMVTQAACIISVTG